MKFLSDRSISQHKEYVKTLTHRLTALEKSAPEVIGKSLSEIKKRHFLNKNDIIRLRAEIECHNIFFSSFGNMYQSSQCVKNTYTTEASFLYELLEAASETEKAFMGIYMKRGVPQIALGNPTELLNIETPILAVDLCEHAYFLDFGFSKREYLKNLLPYLNLSKLV